MENGAGSVTSESQDSESHDSKSHEPRSAMIDRVESLRRETAGRLGEAAADMRRKAGENELDDNAQASVERFADHIESAARFLDEHSIGELEGEATARVFRNPWQALLGALFGGLLLGLLLGRSGRSRARE